RYLHRETLPFARLDREVPLSVLRCGRLRAAGGGEANLVLVVVLRCGSFPRRWRRWGCLLFPFDNRRKRPCAIGQLEGEDFWSVGPLQHKEELLTALLRGEANRPLGLGSDVIAQPQGVAIQRVDALRRPRTHHEIVGLGLAGWVQIQAALHFELAGLP